MTRIIRYIPSVGNLPSLNELNQLNHQTSLSKINKQYLNHSLNTSSDTYLDQPTISDRMKQAISNLNNTSGIDSDLITQNKVISSIDLLNSMKEKVNNAYNDDQIEYINEERETINVELDKNINDIGDIDAVIIFDGKMMKKGSNSYSNSNDYIKTPKSDIIITNVSDNNSVIEVGESTIPSNLENVINPSAYSNTHEFQINKNLINVESQLNYNGPTIVTESANETLEKMIIKYNFNDEEINLLKLKVKEILGNNDLNGIDLLKKVETSNTDCNKFRSFNELNQDKQIYSSKVLTLKNCSNEKVTIQVSKLTNNLIKTNNVKVKDLVSLDEFIPKRKLMFLTKREINILANSLKYNKQDFENIALKLRIKHHRITDFAPVYKNGIYVRFAKWNEKLGIDEYFATNPLKVIIF